MSRLGWLGWRTARCPGAIVVACILSQRAVGAGDPPAICDCRSSDATRHPSRRARPRRRDPRWADRAAAGGRGRPRIAHGHRRGRADTPGRVETAARGCGDRRDRALRRVAQRAVDRSALRCAWAGADPARRDRALGKIALRMPGHASPRPFTWRTVSVPSGASPCGLSWTGLVSGGNSSSSS